MGQPTSYDYPNQAVQYPIQQTVEVIKHETTDRWQQIILLIGDTIGYPWLFALIVMGAFVVAGVVFKKHLKKILGVWVEALNNFINNDK
jgi:hypothetical protein